MLELSAVGLRALVQAELQQNPVLEEFGCSSAEIGEFILPDLIVRKVGGEYVVSIKEGAIPQLRISETYESLMAQPDVSDEVRDYIRAKTAAAKRLIESLEQRREVLLTIGSAIVKSQGDFLENRSCPIMPMALPTVAVLAGLSNKYIQTPSGIFALAKFFPQKPDRN
jgi:RNA polymerase sigma-54 factor